MKAWEATPLVEVSLDFGAGPLLVGRAAATGRTTFFEYDDQFITKGISPSPLRLKLSTGPQAGAEQLDGLPGLLDDSLPDGWSRLVLDRYIRSQGCNPASLSPLDRIALVGHSGPGAMVYGTEEELPVDAPLVDFDTAAELVTNAELEEDADRLRAAMSLAGSLGGARPKAHVWLYDGRLTTQQTSGARQWIIKFAAKLDGPEAGAIEYAYSLMAKAAAIDVPRTLLLPSKENAGYFAVERFDRTAQGGRLHVHSLGGLLNASCRVPSLGYEELLRVTGALAGADAIPEQIRRMAFNIYARNRDDHVKNHAFLMNEEGTWRPSPVFDVTYWDGREHQLIVGSEGATPSLENMLEVTRTVGFADDEASSIINEVEAVIREWPKFAKEAGVSPQRISDIHELILGGIHSPDPSDLVAAAWERTKGLGR